MGINSTIIGQTITFALFVLFTMKYVWPPIAEAMAERQKRIADGLAAADQSQQALAEAQGESEAALKDARATAQDVISNANRQATDIVEKAKADARAEADRIVASAHAELEAEVAKAKASLREEVSAIALKGAEQILGREVDAAAHDDILKTLAAKV